MHPGPEITIHPGAVTRAHLLDGIVPDSDTFLIVRDFGTQLRNDELNQACLPIVRDAISLVTRPNQEPQNTKADTTGQR